MALRVTENTVEVGPLIAHPDVDYEVERWQHTPLLESIPTVKGFD